MFFSMRELILECPFRPVKCSIMQVVCKGIWDKVCVNLIGSCGPSASCHMTNEVEKKANYRSIVFPVLFLNCWLRLEL